MSRHTATTAEFKHFFGKSKRHTLNVVAVRFEQKTLQNSVCGGVADYLAPDPTCSHAGGGWQP
jgi:hypothetical protein